MQQLGHPGKGYISCRCCCCFQLFYRFENCLNKKGKIELQWEKKLRVEGKEILFPLAYETNFDFALINSLLK